jgi:hypothetical protein
MAVLQLLNRGDLEKWMCRIVSLVWPPDPALKSTKESREVLSLEMESSIDGLPGECELLCSLPFPKVPEC